MRKNLRIAALTAAVVAGPMFAQTNTAPQTVQTQSGPQSGSPGSEVPNDTAAAPNPAANSSYQRDANGDMGLNLGWLGLLGLGGLFGLRRSPAPPAYTEHEHDMHHSPSRG